MGLPEKPHTIPTNPVLLGRLAVDALIEAFHGLRGHGALQAIAVDDPTHEARAATIFPVFAELRDGSHDRCFGLLFLRGAQLWAQRRHLIGLLHDHVLPRELDAVPIRERIILGDRVSIVPVIRPGPRPFRCEAKGGLPQIPTLLPLFGVGKANCR